LMGPPAPPSLLASRANRSGSGSGISSSSSIYLVSPSRQQEAIRRRPSQSSKMANAMLEESFKSSHPDLLSCGGLLPASSGQLNGSHDYDTGARHRHHQYPASPGGPHHHNGGGGGAPVLSSHVPLPHPPAAGNAASNSGGTGATARRGALQSICRSSHNKFDSAAAAAAASGGGGGAIALKDVSPSRKKSVDFALSDHHRRHQQRGSDRHPPHNLKHPSSPPSAPPPAKRTRTSEPWSPKQVVDGAFVSSEPLLLLASSVPCTCFFEVAA
jgi:hypothetical protein